MRPIPKPSIVTVWEHYGGTVIGADRGGWRKATCVLHEDRTPSASINEDECRFSCFVCQLSGDVIDLIQKVEHVGWAVAKQRAESFLDEASPQVRGDSGSSSLLPRRSGNRPTGRKFTPPWSRL